VIVLTSNGCRSRAPVRTQEKVGPAGVGRVVTPANQILTPAGIQVELPGMRPQAVALSPDAQLLVTSGKTHELIVIDPAGGKSCSVFACLRTKPMSRAPMCFVSYS